MFRLIIALLFLLIFFLLSLLALPVEWILGRSRTAARDRSSLWVIQTVFKIILFISGTELIVKGQENLLPDKAVLYVGNHRGFFDIIAAYTLMPSLTGFVAKKEMQKIPILYHWMKLGHCLFLDRVDVRQGLKTILEGINKVNSGISIFIFPEGTRGTSDLDPMPFKEGSLKIASKTGCPIIPVAINNSASVLLHHPLRLKKARIVLEFGEPIIESELEESLRKSLAGYTRTRIVEMLQKNAPLT